MSENEARKSLVEEFRRFLLSSSKNTEQFDEHLIREITVSTQLDELVVDVISEGRDVVISGTAGSGKTHLLRTISTNLNLPAVEFGTGKEPDEPYIRVVSDLTALSDSLVQAVWTLPTDGRNRCRSIVVAANEGTLLSAARASDNLTSPVSKYSHARRLLHAIQRGERCCGGADDIAVIDAAAFDPAGTALSQMLSSPLLREVVEGSECECPAGHCPRKTAWKQLHDQTVCDRVSVLVSAVAREAEGFTFRMLWNFVADLALGGSCEPGAEGVPTSPWFYRVFNGATEISGHISSTLTLHHFPMPHVDSHIWYADYQWLRGNGRLLPVVSEHFVLPPSTPSVLPASFDWAKAEVLFGSSCDHFMESILLRGTAGLWSDIVQHKHDPLLRAINSYMLYGLVDNVSSDLELWLDFSLERRLNRSSGQVSVGRRPSTEFRVVPSLVCANPPESSASPLGTRWFLRHESSGATLAITKDFLTVITNGRSFRMSDRMVTETDWLLMRFFSDVASDRTDPMRLLIARFDFASHRCQLTRWRIGTDRKVTVGQD